MVSGKSCCILAIFWLTSSVSSAAISSSLNTGCKYSIRGHPEITRFSRGRGVKNTEKKHLYKSVHAGEECQKVPKIEPRGFFDILQVFVVASSKVTQGRLKLQEGALNPRFNNF